MACQAYFNMITNAFEKISKCKDIEIKIENKMSKVKTRIIPVGALGMI